MIEIIDRAGDSLNNAATGGHENFYEFPRRFFSAKPRRLTLKPSLPSGTILAVSSADLLSILRENYRARRFQFRWKASNVGAERDCPVERWRLAKLGSFEVFNLLETAAGDRAVSFLFQASTAIFRGNESLTWRFSLGTARCRSEDR